MKATVGRLFLMLLVSAWVVGLGSVLALPYFVELNDPGDFLIRNTVRLALLYWAIASACLLRGGRRLACRLAWTLACSTYLVHVGVSFEYAHHWSHAEAFEHVKQASGFGEGIFVSYFFTFLWTADAVWWWLDRTDYEQRPRWLSWAIHGFMVFIIVNGAIIFESGPIRWVGVIVLIGLGLMLSRRMNRKQAYIANT